MTTNSYGSHLPRFDFEPLRPVVAKASIARAVPLTTGVYALPIIAAVGLSVYAQSQVTRRRLASSGSSSLQDIRRHNPENFHRDHEFWENLEVACGVWT
ncbi:hypothetical protein UCREL1_1406 [Eutypa lata UCREL1]|uniref:Uncharacterized protein n=1 Tax=Eutypa lata (strain UCR-EL1) TaxID=1287681 RepID=M7SY51_EUTLA|nr:hypothetical protein UCREL1_1406 [Eutypa lata UCREL1]